MEHIVTYTDYVRWDTYVREYMPSTIRRTDGNNLLIESQGANSRILGAWNGISGYISEGRSPERLIDENTGSVLDALLTQIKKDIVYWGKCPIIGES